MKKQLMSRKYKLRWQDHVISQSGQEIAVKANFSMVDNTHYGKLVYQTMTTA